MLVINRFAGPGPGFAADAEAVRKFWLSRPGCLNVEVVQNLDDPALFAVVSSWADVGSYRRSFQGVEAKLLLTPFFAACLDEPSAYLPASELGANVPRGESSPSR
ncbi:MAG: putative quinol monooxygenase [Arachnia sp.]